MIERKGNFSKRFILNTLAVSAEFGDQRNNLLKRISNNMTNFNNIATYNRLFIDFLNNYIKTIFKLSEFHLSESCCENLATLSVHYGFNYSIESLDRCSILMSEFIASEILKATSDDNQLTI